MGEYKLTFVTVVFWGQRGWVLGLQFRDWRVGGGQNHHTGLTGGHIRDGGSHRVSVGVALGGARRRMVFPNRPSGHPLRGALCHSTNFWAQNNKSKQTIQVNTSKNLGPPTDPGCNCSNPNTEPPLSTVCPGSNPRLGCFPFDFPGISVISTNRISDGAHSGTCVATLPLNEDIFSKNNRSTQ